MATHELKTVGLYWDAIERGEKLFEVRRNDRFFQAGDVVHLLRLDPVPFMRSEIYTTASKRATTSNPNLAARLSFRIGPILQGGQFGIEPGYCVFSLLPLATTGAPND